MPYTVSAYVPRCSLCGHRHHDGQPVELLSDGLGHIVSCLGPTWAAEAWRRGWYMDEGGQLRLGPSAP